MNEQYEELVYLRNLLKFHLNTLEKLANTMRSYRDKALHSIELGKNGGYNNPRKTFECMIESSKFTKKAIQYDKYCRFEMQQCEIIKHKIENLLQQLTEG